MKLNAPCIVGMIAMTSAGAYAQVAVTQNLPKVRHVVMIVQENRTPDNLFGSDAFASPAQLPGADLAKKANCQGTKSPLTSFQLDACFDPNHGHGVAPHDDAWVKSFDNGALDGACVEPIGIPAGCTAPTIPEQTYVTNSNQGIQPYFDIAKQYGFANYMFQTNQGPSFEAHQFLFGGTSAPDYFNDTTTNCGAYPCYQWFASENEKSDGFGCTAGTSANIYQVDPAGNESQGVYNNGFPCYNHLTLADLLDQNRISWKYYPQGPKSENSLWTAPNAVQNICQPSGGVCTGPDWVNRVQPNIPPSPPVAGEMAPILSDIQNCKLPAVSWVIPDGVWSDHPGSCPQGGCINGTGSGHYLGPAWVADIVNAIGGATTCDKVGYWDDTVILIAWDDWGGFYDHVMPWDCNASGHCGGFSNNTGGQYVYGFRVPLMVVSAYNYRPKGAKGYISGACGKSGDPACPNTKAPYIHDFGSMLNFVEYAFGQNGKFLTYPQATAPGISPNYPYADFLAPDAYTSGNCAQSVCPYGLSDFFNFKQSPTAFKQIALPPVLQQFTAAYFQSYGTHAGDLPAADPDDDAIDEAAWSQ